MIQPKLALKHAMVLSGAAADVDGAVTAAGRGSAFVFYS